MKKTGAQIIVSSLEKQGVNVVFGYPGGAVIPLYDELYKQKSIRQVLVRHEQGAAHAADAYARSTGNVGVCIATSGPGATNLVTGIATAYMDSVPLVAFTGQVPTAMIGNDSFQESDIYGITIPITKYNYIVKKAEDLPHIIAEAFYIARTGRPGPVLIDLPKDVQVQEIEPYEPQIDLDLLSHLEKDYESKLEKIKKMLDVSKKPLLYIGGGVVSSEASEELRKFVEITNIPVTSTLLGLGSIPSDHPLFLGMLGMHGTQAANYAVCECDLLIALGARFDDRVTGKVCTFATKANVIHIDIDPAEVGKIIKPELYIVNTAKNVLRSMLGYGFERKEGPWEKQIKEWKEKYPLSYDKESKHIKPQYVVETISRLTKGQAMICTEVGQNQMWAAQYYNFQFPRQFISSGGLGTMGYGLPAANGVQLAHPKKHVWDIAGDGSILMNIQELATAVNEKLPVKIAVLNNGYLGMVRQWQELFFEKRYSNTVLGKKQDLVKIIEAFGGHGFRADKPEEVEPVIKKALEIKDGPVLIDFHVDPCENVFPMVPAGGSNLDMITGCPVKE